MKAEGFIKAGVAARGDTECVLCETPIAQGDRVVTGEYRVGGKVIGKDIRVGAHVSCVRELRDLLDLRIKEATS